jgi:hypothetical protein
MFGRNIVSGTQELSGGHYCAAVLATRFHECVSLASIYQHSATLPDSVDHTSGDGLLNIVFMALYAIKSGADSRDECATHNHAVLAWLHILPLPNCTPSRSTFGRLSHTHAARALEVGFGLPDEPLHAPNECFDLDNYYNGGRTIAALLTELATMRETTG